MSDNWEFGKWWREVNRILEGDGYDIRFGDARRWYGEGLAPAEAAIMRREESLAERNSVYQAEAVLDMWYGSRDWRDDDLPLEMDVGLANPAYVVHNQLSEIEHRDHYHLPARERELYGFAAVGSCE